MRFIFNFIFFGVLFFLIWHFFPEAFAKLTEWAADIYNFFSNLVQMAVEKVSPMVSKPATPVAPPAHEVPKALLRLFS